MAFCAVGGKDLQPHCSRLGNKLKVVREKDPELGAPRTAQTFGSYIVVPKAEDKVDSKTQGFYTM